MIAYRYIGDRDSFDTSYTAASGIEVRSIMHDPRRPERRMRIPDTAANAKKATSRITRDNNHASCQHKSVSQTQHLLCNSSNSHTTRSLPHSMETQTKSSMQQVNVVAPCAMQEGELQCEIECPKVMDSVADSSFSHNAGTFASTSPRCFALQVLPSWQIMVTQPFPLWW
jgi:hypothetical protein